MTRVIAAGVAAVCIVASGAASGCGGAARQESTTSISVGTLEGAQAELDAAEASLVGAFGVGATLNFDAHVPVPGQHPPVAPAPSPSGPSATITLSEGSCEVACKALDSMKRASERICVLAEGERCTTARARFTRASDRVRTARCECES